MLYQFNDKLQQNPHGLVIFREYPSKGTGYDPRFILGKLSSSRLTQISTPRHGRSSHVFQRNGKYSAFNEALDTQWNNKTCSKKTLMVTRHVAHVEFVLFSSPLVSRSLFLYRVKSEACLRCPPVVVGAQ